VQDVLGHSQVSLTLDTYSHVIPTMLQEAAEAMGRALSRNE
jgi:site-specific recombinase XerD